MIGYNIRKLMLNKKMTEENLVERSGLRPATVRKLLSGETKNPTLSTLEHVAKGLDVPIENLFKEDDEPTREMYYTDTGKCAVLLSEYYGVGWETENGYDLGTDRRVVAKYIDEKPPRREMKRFLKDIGCDHVNMKAYDSLSVRYVPRGTRFMIVADNGMEDLIIEGKGEEWITA